MDVQGLRWFQAVVDGETVTEVAEIYRVSQPSVSRALARLEREVGTPLLRRSGRGLRPTEAGIAFKRGVDAAIHSLDDGLASVEQLLDPESGRVRLTFAPSLGGWLVPDLVAGFRRHYPRVTFDVHRLDALGPSHDDTALLEGEVDLELTPHRPTTSAVAWRRLFREPLTLAVPPGHRLAGRPEVWLADAGAEDFVMLAPEPPLQYAVDELCADAHVTPRVAFVADDLTTQRGFVAARLGVAVLPAGGNDPSVASPDGVTLVPLADRLAMRDINLLWPTERRLLPAAELFRRYVLREYRPS